MCAANEASGLIWRGHSEEYDDSAFCFINAAWRRMISDSMVLVPGVLLSRGVCHYLWD